MSVLFTPCKIGTMRVPNRFVRSATGARAADPGGRITDVMIGLHERLARGQVGLIHTGHAYVVDEGKTHDGMLGIQKDDLVPDLVRLTACVHQYDSKIVMQINHGGLPVEEVDAAKLQGLVEAFAQAARRVKEAGFDGVQIHGAHGYLISSFASPDNRREDGWGGSPQGRLRLLAEVAHAVRAEVGDAYPVLTKVDGDSYGDASIPRAEQEALIEGLAQLPVDAIEVSSRKDPVREGIRAPDQEGYLAPYAKAIKAGVTCPVILVAGLRSVEVMERVIEDGVADMVSMSRPFIREPDLVARFRAGKSRADCISCGRCATSRETANQCAVLLEGRGART